MRFILNKDKVEIRDKDDIQSGSVHYYEADVEHDESWDDLTIAAVLVERQGSHYADEGTAISVVNNKIYIDSKLDGAYGIGFIGYTIENDIKTYQTSTNFIPLFFNKGAGQIETSNEEIPTPTEWEIYVAQLQDITRDINGLANELETEVQAVVEQLENGDFDGADGQDGADGITPTIGQNGNWYLGDVDTGKPSRGENGTNGINRSRWYRWC